MKNSKVQDGINIIKCASRQNSFFLKKRHFKEKQQYCLIRSMFKGTRRLTLN